MAGAREEGVTVKGDTEKNGDMEKLTGGPNFGRFVAAMPYIDISGDTRRNNMHTNSTISDRDGTHTSCHERISSQ